MDVPLKAALSSILAENKLPGVVAAVIEKNEIASLQSSGIRKVGNQEPFIVHDIVHLGSNTKALSALLICQLIERGLLNFETTIVEIFPEFSGFITARSVSVRNLIEHTSGLLANLNWQHINITQSRCSLQQQRYHVVNLAFANPSFSLHDLGHYSYSNTGYVVLGAIIEKLTGKSWEENVQENIFSPLGMSTGGFGVIGEIGSVTQPWGHTANTNVHTFMHSAGTGVFSLIGRWFASPNSNGNIHSSSDGDSDGNTTHINTSANTPVQIDNPAVMAPAGGVHCSVNDYAKFIIAVKTLMKAALDISKIPVVLSETTSTRISTGDCVVLGVSARTYARCMRLHEPLPAPSSSNYAGGWILATRRWANGLTMTHSESNTTWYCTVWIAPITDRAFIVAFNSGAEPVSTASNAVVTKMIELCSS